MEYFSARNQKPAEYCEQKVLSCDLYVGIIGFRYGSPVRDRPEISYTELEYEVASKAPAKDRLIFLLDEAAAVPLNLFTDARYRERQDDFRKRLQDSGLIIRTFSNPDQLERLLYQALVENREACLEDLLARSNETTKEELRSVGRKYILDLYFPRTSLETHFGTFLESDKTCFLVVAKAGRGKTNFMCHIVDQWNTRRPVLFIIGRIDPRDDYGFLRRLSNRLGYGDNWTKYLRDFQPWCARHLNPLVLIDGINESPAPPPVRHLMGHQIQQLF